MTTHAKPHPAGRHWELLAEAHLRCRGLRLVSRNVHSRFGEIDLVMRDADVLVFVEVRYRGPGAWTDGFGSVTATKQQRLRRAAGWYLAHHPRDACRPCRFDIVSIERGPGWPRCRWMKNAFE